MSFRASPRPDPELALQGPVEGPIQGPRPRGPEAADWYRPFHSDWTRDLWPDIPVDHPSVESLAEVSGRIPNEIRDLRYMHEDKPRPRKEDDGECKAACWTCGLYKWWRPPLAVQGSVHDLMVARVEALLREAEPPHPRGDTVMFVWTKRYRRTTDSWVHGLRFADRALPLLPGCLWCGMPTASGCEGTQDMVCMAALCPECNATFGASCPPCSWWMGLPPLNSEIAEAAREVLEEASEICEPTPTDHCRTSVGEMARDHSTQDQIMVSRSRVATSDE